MPYRIRLESSSARLESNWRQGKLYDMVFTYSFKEERTSYLLYAREAHIYNNWHFFVLRENLSRFRYDSLDDLKGLRVGATQGFSYTKEFWAAVEADLKSLKAALADSRDLRTLVGSPAFSAENKGKGLAAIAAKASFNATTIKFLGLLAANGRASVLPDVITAFQRMAAEARGVVAAKVTSAVPLTAAQSKGVAAAVTDWLVKAPSVTLSVVPRGRTELALADAVEVRVS